MCSRDNAARIKQLGRLRATAVQVEGAELGDGGRCGSAGDPIANAFCVVLFYQFFKDIPRELDEAAMMDGQGPLRIGWSIIMPSSKPVIVTVAIILSPSMWNQYLWPALVVPGQENRPVMVGIQQFLGAANRGARSWRTPW